MRCINCNCKKTEVIASIVLKAPFNNIRRRRQCPECKVRFNTYEAPFGGLYPKTQSPKRMESLKKAIIAQKKEKVKK